MHFVRESVFVSALRSFCSCVGAILGIVVGAVIALFCIFFFSRSDLYEQTSTLTVAADAAGNRDLLPMSAPVLLKIEMNGVVGMGDFTTEKIDNLLLDSHEGMLAHGRVKGILLYMNTPGGEATTADTIYQLMKAYKEKYQVPIYVYVDGLCASGGMYIACAADRIYASPTSVIGSVGVLIPTTFNVAGLLQRFDVQSLTLAAGKDKDMLNPFRPWVPGEDASLRAVVNALYGRFVDIVAASRPLLTKDKLISDYGAQVYIAQQAEQLGYIDQAGSTEAMALTDLAKAAGIDPQTHYQVMTISPIHSFLSELTQTRCGFLSGKITHTVNLGPAFAPELQGKLLYLYQP